MATARIYKVAEILGIESHKVIELLKRDHGIEVKSASSTIEEIVARHFAERVARDLGITIPSGTKFATTPTTSTKGRNTAVKFSEPAKPAVPALGPPRLIKVISPPPEPPTSDPVTTTEPEKTVLSAGSPDAPQGAPETTPAPTWTTPPEQEVARPQTVHLRVEDTAGTVAPTVPSRSQTTPPPMERPPAIPSPKPPIVRPATPPLRPTVQPPLGGPRPLPSQPVRTPASPRPGFPGRPSTPYRPTGPRGPGRSAARRRREQRPTVPTVAPPPITRTVMLTEGMTVKDLANQLEVRAKDVMKKLLGKRFMMNINSTLDTDTGTMIAREFGADVETRTFEEEMLQVETDVSDSNDIVARPPVVTIMGHVDHGKTTLLDTIRQSQVAEKEAGGITQHIGAYTVQVNGRRIVFLDTPGHEAFTMMRARGAQVTDAVVLVVAADDGVMPQTREAIDHSRAAGVPIIVAINKIDKSDASPDRVKRELADLGLTPEEWGGQTVVVETSAKNNQNLELLLEMILLTTELSELKANPTRNAIGTVLEATLDRGRGPVATILVQDGTLRVGDYFIAGTTVGRVRALFDDRGQPTRNAGPAAPVEVLGFAELPRPGDSFQALTNAGKARQIAALRKTHAKGKILGARGGPRLTLETLQQQVDEGKVKELLLVLKADVHGSAEVLTDALSKLGDEKVMVRIVHSGVGAINESDVLLAAATNAIIIGFNVRPDRNAAVLAERERIEIRPHSVIYHITDEVRKAMTGLLEPLSKEITLGSAEVRQTFKVPKFGTAAGCLVLDGRITRSGETKVRLVRDGVVIHDDGHIGSLRRFKDDVSEVKAGLECGIALERFGDVKVGDVIEVFTVKEIPAAV